MNKQELMVFGDSHTSIFNNLCDVHKFSASSCRGLGNDKSNNQIGNKIIKTLQDMDLTKKKCIFMFGNVDTIFCTVYNYNKYKDNNLLLEYLYKTITNYQNFILKIINMFPGISLHIFGVYPYKYDEKTHLNFCKREAHYKNIMNNIDDNSIKFYKPTIVPNKNIMIQLINIFNEKMSLFCKKESIKFYKIENISNKYMNNDKNDHHFNNSIIELWYPIIKQISL
ncbi:hypothetical protein CL656_01605 [bacterium]|nr:hypothetical protein [bacterium]|tara:strand:+ start:2694 stop:3368 length:675 start_codon:yes stop_codon:yes gene_type:complete